MAEQKKTPGAGGNRYVPYEERTGNESIVYFTRDLSAEGLKKIVARVSARLSGKVAVKLHSGEEGNQNFLPPELWKDVVKAVNGTVVECNTAYEGARNYTEQHRRLLRKQERFAHHCVIQIRTHTSTAGLFTHHTRKRPIRQHPVPPRKKSPPVML